MAQQVPVQMRPVQMDVIVTASPRTLEAEVNKRLEQGYLFHGTLQVVVVGVDTQFVQAMVKAELREVSMPAGFSNSNLVVPRPPSSLIAP